MADRDTQFAGFANKLLKAIIDACDVLDTEFAIVDGCVVCNWTQEKLIETIAPFIAQQVYDLVQGAKGMSEVDIYFFLGWLAAKRVVDMDYDPARGFYFMRKTNQTIVEIADEYIQATRPKPVTKEQEG